MLKTKPLEIVLSLRLKAGHTPGLRLIPDCPAEPIDHLHSIRDGEGNNASAKSVPVKMHYLLCLIDIFESVPFQRYMEGGSVPDIEGKDSSKEDDEVSEELNSDAQPPVGHVADENFI